MPITVSCPNCAKSLKIPDTAVGKRVKCPACQTPFTAAEPDDAVTSAPPKPSAVKKPAPPPPRDEEEDEEDEKISATPPKRKPKVVDDEEEEEDEDDRPARKRGKKRYDDEDDDDDDDIPSVRSKKPHRAGTVMTLGILSIPVSCLCPIIAWILGGIAINMANTDLAQMAAKRMDPSGRGNTNTGKICGIVGVVIGFINAIAGIALRIGGGF